ncbi:MAG: hypothetical protein L0227_05355 [Chloroflexi bacterium]|nr:hypothetical protein [Chloroflexota bacterium]
MTLDDRSLREHLDRRAESGVQDPEALAEAVMARVTTVGVGPWWRRLRVGTRSLGIAAAAIVVIVVALAVLPPRLLPGPGASPTSPDPTEATGYPVDRALTALELDAFLGTNPSQRKGDVVIADVDLSIQSELLCPAGGPCPRYRIEVGNRDIYVYDSDPAHPLLPGSHAFRVTDHPDGRLELIGTVRSGPDGLSWTLPQLTAELANLRGPGARPVLRFYLVDAWSAVSPVQPSCLPTTGDPRFTCGTDMAWLMAGEMEARAYVTGLGSATNGLRVPNGATGTGGEVRHGYWLIDPFVDQAGCPSCPPAGAADLVGRVLTLDELAFTAPETTGPPAEPTYPADQALNVLELDAFLGPDPAARAGAIVVANVTLERVGDIVCYGTCPSYWVVLEDRRIAAYDPRGANPDLAGPVALRIRDDGRLDFLGRVRAGPDGLAWTLPQLTAELPDVDAPGARPVPYLYLIDAVRHVSDVAIPCPSAEAAMPLFGCGPDVAWLVPDASSIPADPLAVPQDGLRVPNGPPTTAHGFWLVDPFVTQDQCFMCPPAGAADLIGRITTHEELAGTP